MESKDILNIEEKVYTALVNQALSGMPNEVCGYLAEKDGVVIAHYEMRNLDESPEHFTMQPEEQFKAVKDMRQKGLKLRAVYHSHPETPARPSLEDIKLAYDPNLSYVILSLAGEVPDLKSFRIQKGEVSAEDTQIVNNIH